MRPKDAHQSLAHRKESTEADFPSVSKTTKLLRCIAFPTPMGAMRDPEISTQKTTSLQKTSKSQCQPVVVIRCRMKITLACHSLVDFTPLKYHDLWEISL